MKDLKIEDKFTLVLSGGGALGFAQLNVLQKLEEQKLIPTQIVGTSMGAILGACVAINLSEQEIYNHLKEFVNLTNWVKFSMSGNSIIKTSKIDKILTHIFKDRKLSDAEIELKIVATDLKTGHKRVFTKNDNILIKDAILASMAIPGIFEEKEIEGNLYVDGFLCANLPLQEATLKTIVAVNVLGKNAYDSELPDNFFKTKNVLEMFEKSMRLLILNQSKHLIDNINNSSDIKLILLEPLTKDFNTYSFHSLNKLRAIETKLPH